MLRKLLPLIAVLGLIIFFAGLFGCQKEQSNETKTPAYYLTAQPWYFVQYNEDDSINGTIDYTAYASACETGAFRFSPNDSLYYTPGNTPCSATDVAWQNTWSLDSAGTILHFSNDIYKIRVLNDTLLDYYYDSVYSSGETYRIDFIYRHQGE